MRRSLTAVLMLAALTVALVLASLIQPTATSTGIRLNSVGYLPQAPKQATIASPCTNFTIIRLSDGAVRLEGTVSGPRRNTDTRESLYTAEFSALAEPGEYQLQVAGGETSVSFRIAEEVYHEPFRTVVRAMYLWRCGTAVTGEHNGDTFTHAACHTNEASLDYADKGSGLKASLQGWHDAGDYNKYVVNSGITVGTMFRAWEDFGSAIRTVRLDIPEAGDSLPEYLAELKWELDWLFSMQAPDGSVYHKLSTKDFGSFMMPEEETRTQYIASWSSAATADFAAMMAAAARHFRASDPTYADRCLQAARAAFTFLQSNPENHRADLTQFTTGAYATGDADDRLWAAAEFWETAGDQNALRDFEERVRSLRTVIDPDFDWGNVKNLGLLTYLFSKRAGKDPAVEEQIRRSLLEVADRIVETGRGHGYARPLGTRYYWGCNGGVARQTMILRAAYRISPESKYRDAALDALNHLLGRNFHGRSFVTGLGDSPPMHPHDRRSGADDVTAPWPGYLVGGPHRGATSWEDVEANYRCNEIAINWNAALIYALAAFLDDTAWTVPDTSGATPATTNGAPSGAN